MNALAIVTGGGSGIGRVLAIMLAEQGLDVFTVGRRFDALQETQALHPSKIHIVCADIATPAGRQQFLAALPRDAVVRFLIHNAGVITPIKPLAQLTLEEWRSVQAVNLEAPLFLTQALLPRLINARVLHVSSGAAHTPLEGWLPYNVSKVGLHMLYRYCKKELAALPIAFGSMRPGIPDTKVQADIRDASNPFSNRDYYIQQKEAGALQKVEDVALFTRWLLFGTDKDTFSKEEWDIRDTWHWPKWRGS